MNRFVFVLRLFLLGFGVSANALVGNASLDSLGFGMESHTHGPDAQAHFLDSRPDTFSAHRMLSDRLPYQESLMPESEEEEARSFGESFDVEVISSSGISAFLLKGQEAIVSSKISFNSSSSVSGPSLNGRSRLVLYQTFRI